MTTTNIRFNEKQDFEIIKKVIEANFNNILYPAKINELDYISFFYKNTIISCGFLKHNKIYGKNNESTECSSFGSDRPNDIKTEAFRIIAKYFDCILWENDCNEEEYEVYKATVFLDNKPQNSQSNISHKQTFTEDEVRSLISSIYSEFAELPIKMHNTYYLRRIIEQEIEQNPNKPI